MIEKRTFYSEVKKKNIRLNLERNERQNQLAKTHAYK